MEVRVCTGRFGSVLGGFSKQTDSLILDWIVALNRINHIV